MSALGLLKPGVLKGAYSAQVWWAALGALLRQFDVNTYGGSAAMGLMFRKRKKFGPLIFNFTEHGFSSWTIKVGRWSWNSRSRAQRYDLPGPMSWKQDKKQDKSRSRS